MLRKKMTDCSKCMNEQRIKHLEEEAKKCETHILNSGKALTSLKNKNDLTDYKFLQIMTKLDEMHTSLKELQTKPAKRYEQIVSTALQWLVLALLASIAVIKS